MDRRKASDERSRKASIALDMAATGQAAYLYCDCCGIVATGGMGKDVDRATADDD